MNNACRALFLHQGNLDLLFKRYSAIYNANPTKIDPSSLNISDVHLGDIIIFPAIDWGFRLQRPQHLARELGAKGYRVFYVSIVPQMVSTPTNYLIQEAPSPGVILVQLSSGSSRIPDFYGDELTEEELINFFMSYSRLCDDFEINNPTLLVQHSFWQPLVRGLKKHKLVYDCIDYQTGFQEKPNQNLIESEHQLILDADTVIATSIVLADIIGKIKACHLIRNGCEYERFSSPIPASNRTSGPIIGYVGAVAEWFDGQILFEIAQAKPHWQFEIYGSMVGASDISEAHELSNVHFFGEVDYEEVPSIVAQFDVCIIPFKLNDLTKATNPVKLYEYLAAGKPVVSTCLPELEWLEIENIDVLCATTVNEFINRIERALIVSKHPEKRIARKHFAQKNDWSKRANQMMRLLS